ncbi:MAG: saccharopine dehydrogenase NADP-binding domain-containing protein [Proteobacteria bacterium]|nr:saccharopine dehydrogenase NADP-binding domain-containing protein [Pseudomonadota bacterium]
MEKKKVIVLGAGRVGRVIARDLNDDPAISVTVADRRSEMLESVAEKLRCATISDNLSDPAAVSRVVEGFDLAIGALPGALGLSTLRGVVAAGKKCVDISFMPEDPTVLDGEAKRTGSKVLYDFGVAPGMSNLLSAAAATVVAPVRQIRILVGGLPLVRRQPWEYAAPFSPADVIEEYIRPARIKVGGAVSERAALSGVESVEFPEIGTLEAFYTDGLRSLLTTVACPAMEEKTLRYPGYAKRIGLLRDTGFFESAPIDVNGVMISPRELTLKLLEPAWYLDELMDEFTVMRIQVTGGEEAPYKRVVWELLDRTDRYRNETSMARTTGFPAAIAARALLNDEISFTPGVHPPESLAQDGAFIERLLARLKVCGVLYRQQEQR